MNKLVVSFMKKESMRENDKGVRAAPQVYTIFSVKK